MSVETLSIVAGPSWRSLCLNALLRLLPIKKRTASAAAVHDHVRRMAAQPAPHEPVGLGRGIAVERRDVAGWPVYRTAPLACGEGGNVVLFLHGGGYVKEIVAAHWRFVGHLGREAGARCVVPIYPLAPRGTAAEVVPIVGEMLRGLIQEEAPARVVVVGNSAGAGLALAAAQWLRDRGHAQPDGLVLISPGLDAAIGRPQQQALAAQDPVQDIPGIREAARLYAGGLDLAHPYVSPLRGSMHGLAPMLVFAGTLDLLHPDAIDLATQARAAGVPVELHLRRGQPHNYAGMPTPEGRQARERIVSAVVQGLR